MITVDYASRFQRFKIYKETMVNMFFQLVAVGLFCVLVGCDGDGIRKQCPRGTESYYNHETNEVACCQDITCDKGYQPMPCISSNASSSRCEKCGNRQFSAMTLKLSDRGKCRMRKKCHFFLLEGDESTDATCFCPEKWHHLEDKTMCIPNRDCEKGFGQTDTGRCERCVHGKTFSDKADDRQRCMPVRRCRDEYKCTIREANISSNAICTENVISDIDNCPKPGEPTKATTLSHPSTVKPSTSTGLRPNHDEHTPHQNGDSDSSDSGRNTGFVTVEVIAIIFGLLLGACVLTGLWKLWSNHRKDRHKSHVDIAEHLENAHSSSRRDLVDKVYRVVLLYLAEEACANWRSLGHNLLNEKFPCMECELQGIESNKERMYSLMSAWTETCHSDGPNLRCLFNAMYSPDRYYVWVPFKSLRTRIIDKCALTIQRKYNPSFVHRQFHRVVDAIVRNTRRQRSQRNIVQRTPHSNNASANTVYTYVPGSATNSDDQILVV